MAAIIQLLMVIRFFDMSSDVKDIRDMMRQTITANKSNSNDSGKKIEVLVEEREKSKDDPKKFTWQSWVALAIIIIGVLLYLCTR